MVSSRKKSSISDPKAIYSYLNDLLVTVKSHLADTSQPLIAQDHEDLLQIARLAESFSNEKYRKGAAPFMDVLDQEGVNLWNSSILMRPDADSDPHRKISFAFIRLAAFRLIEAGMPSDGSSIEALIRVLQLANKAAACLAACEQTELAASVLITGAQLEEELQKADDPSGQYAKPKSGAIVSYYSSRMEAAWKEDNESVAVYMLEQAINDQNLQHLDAQEVELIASKVLDIGTSILRSATIDHQNQDGTIAAQRALVAVNWIQKALWLSERVGDKDTLGVNQLKVAILKSLARAYYHSSSTEPDNLAKSEATLQELTAISIANKSGDAGELQQLRWMKLSILKRRAATEQELIQVFKDIIDHLVFTDSNVTEILQEIRLQSSSYKIITTVNQILLERALDSEDHMGHSFVDRILLSQIFCLKDRKEHKQVVSDMEIALTAVAKDPTFTLDKPASVACQSLMFKIGAKLFQSKQYPQAADWFLLCTHASFKSVSSSGDAKCYRKAALCHIHSKAYAQASAVISRCPGNEASTHYLTFLAATYQGREDDAVTAIDGMIKAPDFDRKMLLLATQLAHESHMKNLLLSVLGGLLKTLKGSGSLESELEGMTLIRCMIRIATEMTREPDANLATVLPTLVSYLQMARDLVLEAEAKKSANLIVKDISWLWRTAYNLAIRGCSGWDELVVAELFSCARQLLDVYSRALVGESESNLTFYMVMASFSAACGRVFHARRRDGPKDVQLCSSILNEITSFREITSQHRQANQEQDILQQLDKLTGLSFVFEVEQLCILEDWERIGKVIQDATESKTTISLETFEAIADLLWVRPLCPTHVLYAALEAILKACLERGSMDCDRFSRWLRAIVSILLSRNRHSDREKALGYVEQASDVIKENQEAEYPQDERTWLLTTSYNCGIESLQITDLDHAKRWFEAATLIARYSQGGESRAQQIEDSYRHLLARYGQRSKNAT